jgi:hypothetical protein
LLQYYTKDTRSSTGGSSSIPAHNATKSRRSKGAYASGSTAGTKDGRQQAFFLDWSATSYQQKRRRHTATKELTNQDHHAVTTVLGTEAEVDDLKRHHQGDTTVQRTKEPDDPELPIEHMTTKTMKRRWGRHALPIGFASR